MAKPIISLSELRPEFREVAERFVALVAAWEPAGALHVEGQAAVVGLPVKIWETYRPGSVQDELVKKGVSRAGAGQSPHQHRLAFDVVLDTAHPFWDAHGEHPTDSARTPAPWDLGLVEVTETDAKRMSIARPLVHAVWLAMGRLAKRAANLDPDRPAPNLWGGDWFARGTTTATHLIGWDAGHVQHPDWRRLAGLAAAVG